MKTVESESLFLWSYISMIFLLLMRSFLWLKMINIKSMLGLGCYQLVIDFFSSLIQLCLFFMHNDFFHVTKAKFKHTGSEFAWLKILTLCKWWTTPPYLLVWHWELWVNWETRGHQEGSWLSMCRSHYLSVWRWSERWRLPRAPDSPANGCDP